MLGVCLLFVGIVLINNGICSLTNVSKKAAAGQLPYESCPTAALLRSFFKRAA